jgi:hypothetical protein
MAWEITSMVSWVSGTRSISAIPLSSDNWIISSQSQPATIVELSTKKAVSTSGAQAVSVSSLNPRKLCFPLPSTKFSSEDFSVLQLPPTDKKEYMPGATIPTGSWAEEISKAPNSLSKFQI